MKNCVFIAILFCWVGGHAQFSSLSNEAFINAVRKQVVDSSLAQFYLSANAPACSFKKYDYDEWYKYGLKEDIPIYILNELAKNAFTDTAAHKWQPEKIDGAVCVDNAQAKDLLSPPGKEHVKNRYSGLRANNVVYYFSHPAFTVDYQYAIIDMGFRRDNQQCGMGATFLFKQVNGQWKMVGRKQVWGN